MLVTSDNHTAIITNTHTQASHANVKSKCRRKKKTNVPKWLSLQVARPACKTTATQEFFKPRWNLQTLMRPGLPESPRNCVQHRRPHKRRMDSGDKGWLKYMRLFRRWFKSLSSFSLSKHFCKLSYDQQLQKEAPVPEPFLLRATLLSWLTWRLTLCLLFFAVLIEPSSPFFYI